MTRVALTLAFDGTRYCGWQAQKNGLSVQTAVCEAAAKVYGALVPVTGCSRTDAGVHARGFVCHMDVPFVIPPDALPLALNRALPPDIAVRAACETDGAFHARYSAAGKEYVYRIRNSRLRDPFENGRALLWPHPLDAAALDDAAQAFVGRHDFRSCMASGSKITDTVRRVFRFRVRREDEFVTMTVAADGFLYNMVRIMAGTLLCPGVTAEKITRILDARERGQAGATAPAHGLYLSRVFYPDGLLTPPASTTPKGQATDGRFFHLPRAGEEIRPGEGQNPLEGSIL